MEQGERLGVQQQGPRRLGEGRRRVTPQREGNHRDDAASVAVPSVKGGPLVVVVVFVFSTKAPATNELSSLLLSLLPSLACHNQSLQLIESRKEEQHLPVFSSTLPDQAKRFFPLVSTDH
ncbi:hypothetical protein PR202_gb23070 [Eleusine coracana subsp. coracana]|uniref:Uncharacterized protein n=1 Tax=Eleusine coracana subsp. coracana TaxID=191504 RepID=A0AAV5FHY3_ELECO|nr:hypothetical protein PR202_gb23070 [Eleusine coracana subsp. coracana]